MSLRSLFCSFEWPFYIGFTVILANILQYSAVCLLCSRCDNNNSNSFSVPFLPDTIYVLLISMCGTSLSIDYFQ